MLSYYLNQWVSAFLWINVPLPLTSTTSTKGPLHRHFSIEFFQISKSFCLRLSSRYNGQTRPISSVGRLYLNLPSSDITWNQLPRIFPIFLVSEDSKEEDDKDEEDEEDERLQCLRFFLQNLCLLGEGEDFSVDEDEEVLLQRRLLFECLFLYDFLAVLYLVALIPLFRFSETPLGEFPVSTFPSSLLDPMREELLTLFSEWTCLLCPSSAVSVALLSAIDG